jgi:hypothetical protein
VIGVAFRSPGRVVGVALKELRAGGADYKKRHPLRSINEVFQESEHGVVSPMQILEYQHCGTLLGDVLQEPPPRGERLLAFGLRRGLDPEQGQESLAKPGSLALREHSVELGDRDVGCIRLQDAGMSPKDLAERPERDAFAVRPAPSLAPGYERREAVDVAPELCHDSALPQAGLSDDGDELGRVRRERFVKDALEDRQVYLATDERRVVAGEVGAEPRPWRLRVEHPHRPGLPL